MSSLSVNESDNDLASKKNNIKMKGFSYFGGSTSGIMRTSQHQDSSASVSAPNNNPSRRISWPEIQARLYRNRIPIGIACLIALLLTIIVPSVLRQGRQNNTDKFYVNQEELPSMCAMFKERGSNGTVVRVTGIFQVAVMMKNDPMPASSDISTSLQERPVPITSAQVMVDGEAVTLFLPPSADPFPQEWYAYIGQEVAVVGMIANCSLFLEDPSEVELLYPVPPPIPSTSSIVSTRTTISILSRSTPTTSSRSSTRSSSALQSSRSSSSLKSTSVSPRTTMSVSTSSTRTTSFAPTPTPARLYNTTVTNPRKLAVIFFNFRDDPSQPMSPTAFRSKMFGTPTNSLNSFFAAQSWNTNAFVGMSTEDVDLFGWVTIAANKSGVAGNSCPYSDWVKMAHTAAGFRQGVASFGNSLDRYAHITYVSNNPPGCSWGGMGSLNGYFVMLKSVSASIGLWSHELGHNLGFHHASTYLCTTNGVASLTGTAATCKMGSEYADNLETMGSTGSAHFSISNRLVAKWAATVNKISVSGIYTLEPVTQSVQTGNPIGYYYQLPASRTIVTSDGSASKVITHLYFENRGCFMYARFHQAPGAMYCYTLRVGTNFAPGQGFADTFNRINVTVSSFGGLACSTSNPNLVLSISIW
jgi:hypothetical protein